ncbi:sodium/hydrogen exchanger 9B2-like [Convolutriloba macropyga]|uniref:sodium/hydrogen exchanger 9B2-like n=1 Tax=Convolutriloba macropyga TaxID=536237 RepID=UPI003F51AF91
MVIQTQPTQHIQCVNSPSNDSTQHNQPPNSMHQHHTHPHAKVTRSTDRASLGAGTNHSAEQGTTTTNPSDLCPKAVGRLCNAIYRTKAVQFCLLSENALPEEPTKLQQVRWYFLCPPHSHFGWVLTRVLGLLISWAALWGIVGKEEAYFGGNMFSIFSLYVASRVTGFLIGLFGLPPLLGMLLAGILLNNITLPFTPKPIAEYIAREYRVALRDFSFITILIRAGLSLNPKGLLLMKSVVIRLALCPGVLAEGPIIALLAYFFFDMPFNWAFMLGFILAAVSPAVVVPSLLKLQNKGYGVEQGIPTLIIAAASIDDIIAISAFSVVMSISFVDGNKPLYQVLLHAPTEIAVGLVASLIAGIIMWYIPPPQKHELDKRGHPLLRTENHTTARFLILFGTGIMFMFGFQRLHLAGAGALGCLAVSFITGLGWDIDTKRPVGEAFGHAWNSLMPLLFGLIGTEIKFDDIESSIVMRSLIVLLGGLIVRVCVSFLTVMGVGLNFKEQLFVAIAWIPKATVQAAISGIPLDLAMESNDQHKIKLGRIILTISVLAILLSAPLGALGIRLTGQRLLQLPKRIVTRRSFRRRSSIQKSDGYPRPLIAMNLLPSESNDIAEVDTPSPTPNPMDGEKGFHISANSNNDKSISNATTMVTINETANVGASPSPTTNGAVVVIQPNRTQSNDSSNPQKGPSDSSVNLENDCNNLTNSVDV